MIQHDERPPLAPSHVVLATGSRAWTDTGSVLAALADLWAAWGSESVISPLLLVDDCPTGLDAMITEMFTRQGLATQVVAADWSAHGRRAGPMRNQQMVDLAVRFRKEGSVVAGLAFLQTCTTCNPATAPQQLLQVGVPGHFSHGTAHCRWRARSAGIAVTDVIDQRALAQ